MRPRTLAFQGIRSYRQLASITFDDHDLFAVIGDTGAGKSTILEALCFALYARKTWSGGAKEDLIADGCDVLVVEFTFDADGHTWKVTRSRRRSKASPVDKLESLDNQVPTVDGAGAVTERVTELLGLTFEQFTRAVVMPQGRFDELLKASESERNKILKSILGLGDLAAISDALVAVRSEVRDIRLRHEERRAHLPADPAGALAEARERARTTADAHRRLAEAIVAATEPRRTLVSAQTADALAAALDAVPALDDPTAALASLAARGAELAARSDDATAAADKAGADAEAAETALANALDGFDDRDALTACTTRVRDARRALPGLTSRHDSAVEARRCLDGDVPADHVDPALTAAVTNTAETAAQAKAALDDAHQSRNRLAGLADRLVETRAAQARLDEAAADAAGAVTDAETALAQAEADVEGAQAAHARAVQAEEALRYANAVADIAADHEPGDDCPVCQRPLPDTFVAPDATDLAAASATTSQARETLDAATEVVTDATAALAGRRQAHSTAAEAADTNRGTAADLARQITDAGGDADARAVEAIVATADAEIGRTGQAVADADGRLTAAREALATATAELEGARRAHRERTATADSAVADARTALEEATTGLVASLPGSWKPTGPVTVGVLDELLTRAGATTDALDTHGAALADARTRAGDAQREIDRLRTEAVEDVSSPARDLVAVVNAHLDRVRDVVSCACALGADVTHDDLGAIAVPAKIADLEGTVDAGRGALGAAATVTDAAATVLEATRADIDHARDRLDTIFADVGCGTVETLHAATGTAATEAATATKAVTDAEAAVDAAAKVDAVLDVAVPLADNVEVLAMALRDNQFVDYLLGLREAELLAEATRRLRVISNNRFGFVADFGVKNIVSGEIRTPDSLSGGERFQASLALALALVEIASRGGGRLDAVFVDEGFGSLDANALETALSTLGRVAGAGKMVALISHLRSVAEHVDTVMHVRRDDVTGSRIDTLTVEERDALLADDITSGLIT